MKIGILGGTFDPIHNGHLYLAKAVCRRLGLSKILFIPTNLPPHKNSRRITEARYRYNMVKLAVSKYKKFKVSDIEIKRRGKSYSIETLRKLKKLYGPKKELYFITGSDSLRELREWRRLDEMLGLCRFVIVERPGFKIKNAPTKFLVLRLGALGISSSVIRKRLEEGHPITKLVPQKVKNYIYKNKLYKF